MNEAGGGDEAANTASSPPSLFGGWRGTYTLRDGGIHLPVRFEIAFTPKGGGSLVAAPEARCAVLSHVAKIGLTVRFVATFAAKTAFPSPALHCIGTMTGDGASLTGTCRWITRRAGKPHVLRGRWEARRAWRDD